MSRPRRGEIWLVDFGVPIGREQAGRRPAVIVSADLLNDSRAGTVIVVPCTTTRRGLPSHIEFDAGLVGSDGAVWPTGQDGGVCLPTCEVRGGACHLVRADNAGGAVIGGIHRRDQQR